METREMKHPRLEGKMTGWLEGSWTELKVASIKNIQTYTYADLHGELIVFNPEQVAGYYHSVAQPVFTGKRRTLFAKGKHTWSIKCARREIPFAMVMTPRHLWTAGARNKEGSLEARLMTDGSVASKLKLDSLPIFDGLVVAESKIFLSTRDGRLHCFAPGAPGAEPPAAR